MHYKKQYQFSEDWFTYNIPVWQWMFERFKGKENLHYLEIGVFEGRSAIWMLENVLTHLTARLTAVDIFFGDLEKTFRENLEKSGSQSKVNILKGTSQQRLRQLPLDSFDIIYIDGSHRAKHVFLDAALSWDLLKPLLSPQFFAIFRPLWLRETPSKGDIQMPQPVCPKCSSNHVKRVSRNGFERLMSVFYIYPFRCKPCGHRFRILQRGITYTRIELDRTLDRSGGEKQPIR